MITGTAVPPRKWAPTTRTLTIISGWIHRFFTQYTITTKRLNIRRGILSKTESSTNLDRIQNITVKQSPIDRIVKVGSIDFDTELPRGENGKLYKRVLRDSYWQGHGTRVV